MPKTTKAHDQGEASEKIYSLNLRTASIWVKENGFDALIELLTKAGEEAPTRFFNPNPMTVLDMLLSSLDLEQAEKVIQVLVRNTHQSGGQLHLLPNKINNMSIDEAKKRLFLSALFIKREEFIDQIQSYPDAKRAQEIFGDDQKMLPDNTRLWLSWSAKDAQASKLMMDIGPKKSIADLLFAIKKTIDFNVDPFVAYDNLSHLMKILSEDQKIHFLDSALLDQLTRTSFPILDIAKWLPHKKQVELLDVYLSAHPTVYLLLEMPHLPEEVQSNIEAVAKMIHLHPKIPDTISIDILLSTHRFIRPVRHHAEYNTSIDKEIIDDFLTQLQDKMLSRWTAGLDTMTTKDLDFYAEWFCLLDIKDICLKFIINYVESLAQQYQQKTNFLSSLFKSEDFQRLQEIRQAIEGLKSLADESPDHGKCLSYQHEVGVQPALSSLNDILQTMPDSETHIRLITENSQKLSKPAAASTPAPAL